MINLKIILNNTEMVKANLKSRGFDISKIDEIISLGKKRSEIMTKLQNIEAKRNFMSKEIGNLMSKNEDATIILNDVAKLKKEIEVIKEEEKLIVSSIDKKLLYIPNLALKDVPVGKTEDDNVVLDEHILGRGKVIGKLPHYELAKKLDIVDFERAVKLSGARFWAYKGLGAKLVRALENFMLDQHILKGYTELRPPVIVKSDMLKGTGQFPKFKEDSFKLEGTDSYLIPTAEVPLTNFYNGEILDLSETIKFTAFTQCFRSEAGSGGKDMKGLIRAHQFNKVELVKITTEENSEKEFNSILSDAKNILDKLQLSYQELLLCTGDLGFTSQKTVDLEVWMPSENRYREISSVSSFGDFQSRRASIRYKNIDGKNSYAYTLNGSALAIDRTVAAILENYQNDDGSVAIPDVLIPYMGIKEVK